MQIPVLLRRQLSAFLLAGMLLSACAAHQPLTTEKERAMKPEVWVETTLKQMTLEQKVGQMFFASFTGEPLPEDSPEWRRLQTLVREQQVGGFHLWRGEPYATTALINALQKITQVPLLFEADFEHGTGWRFAGGVDFPPAMALAATGDTTLAFEMGRITGEEARAMGIHLTFSPVVDVNSNPANPIINTRSFGETPQQVIAFANAFIHGAQSAGLLTTAKHFPGHGDTGLDSHLALATIDADSARLFSLELAPFRAAIETGVDAVMSAHILLRRWPMPPYTPATLSQEILTGLLREKLGFDGLVFTDAMGMHAVSHNFTERLAAVLAVKAGADVILVPPDLAAAKEAVVEAVRQGEIPESRVDASVRRILRAKAKVGLHRNRFVDVAHLAARLGKGEAQRAAEDAAARAMTLLRNRNGVVPVSAELAQKRVQVVLVSNEPMPEAGRVFVEELQGAIEKLQVDVLHRDTPEEMFHFILKRARSADLLVLPLFAFVRAYANSTELPEEVWQRVDSLLALPSPAIAVSFGSPYLLPHLSQAEAYLCAYGPTDLLQRAAANAILGRSSISGKIPVSLPGYFQRGDGIEVTAPTAVPLYTAPSPAPRVRFGLPSEAGFTREGLQRVDSLMQQAAADSVFPGAVLLIARNAVIAHFKAYGRMGYGDFDRPMPKNAIFDLASLTKVVATTTAAMLLVQEGKLDLNARVQHYLPGFRGAGKEKVTVRHLLTHSSGLPPFKKYFLENLPPGEIIRRILEEPLEYSPGQESRYSDLGMILLGKIIEKLSGQPLDQFCRQRIFEPLGMGETGFKPPQTLWSRIPPTEEDPWRGRIVHGVVHDENAYALGGVAGHAGLFASARDLAVFAQMLLNGGRYAEVQLLRPEIIAEFTRRQNLVPGSSRALGWDTRSAEHSTSGHYMSMRAFGHTGFTGTSIWVDPEQNLFVILLSNRVHPTRENRKIYSFRPRLHDAVMLALQKPPADAGK